MSCHINAESPMRKRLMNESKLSASRAKGEIHTKDSSNKSVEAHRVESISPA